jgi:hypothetical protein
MINLSAGELAALTIALFIVLLAARAALPGAVLLLRPSGIRAAFTGGPESLEDLAESAGAHQLVDRIIALGFEPLGVKVEYFPLWGSVSSLALASPKARAFASIGVRGQSVRVLYYYTVFTDGALVLTADGLFQPLEQDDYVISVIPATSPRELLDIHHEQLDRLIDNGHNPLEDYSQEARLAATDLFYAAAPSRRRLRVVGLQCLLILLFLLSMAAAVLWLGFVADFGPKGLNLW